MTADKRTSLDHSRLVDLLRDQRKALEKRFPGRGLCKVASLVEDTFLRAPGITDRILKPNYLIRGLVLVLALLMLATVIFGLIELKFSVDDGWSVLEGIEAGISTVVYSGIAIVFLISIELRQRRQMTLEALQELRALAHVLDMHQMNKDPEYYMFPDEFEPDGFAPHLTPAELERYLDYTADLLSLLGKLAAWYAQKVNDPEIVLAINELEQLTGDMTRKIWQKISIINSIALKQ